MAGSHFDLAESAWQAWTDPVHGRNDRVRWTTAFPESFAPMLGIVEIDPGGILPFHHHEPAEIYHVAAGFGEVEISGERHPLHPGITAYVPSDCWHETRNTGAEPLRILFFFPEVPLQDVAYRFS
ncbi:cupin domain-containing protein [Amorphus sp. 3PC139-8]|uniref:cupin domain-containing protein n=1 Tax=Amorphus sp. 3PC139-8 TaxID=2735676 RepID=UPI00345D072C